MVSVVKRGALGLVAMATFAWTSIAAADPSTPEPAEPTASPPDASRAPDPADIRTRVPNYAYAYTARGASARTLGAQVYGLGVAGAGQKSILGGGITVWGSPVDRLTIVGDGQRNQFGNFSPSLGVVVRIVGSDGDGWSVGGLGKFKVDGFGVRPGGRGTPPANPGEVEGEVEGGLLLSYAKRGGVHFDLNAVTGFGTGDDGEIDAEGRMRLGYDVSRSLRVGVDGQVRARMNGPKYLPNGRIWDFAAGPQAILGTKSFFGSLTAGPATMGLLSNAVGWNAIASVGGTTF